MNQQQLLPFLDLLNKTIQKVAKKEKATYVTTADAIAENYQGYLPNPRNIHLSEEGYEWHLDQSSSKRNVKCSKGC